MKNFIKINTIVLGLLLCVIGFASADRLPTSQYVFALKSPVLVFGEVIKVDSLGFKFKISTVLASNTKK